LRGSQPYGPHTDTTGGGSGYKFTDPDLGTVILRYTEHGARIEIGGMKYLFK